MCAPKTIMDDGLLEFSHFKPISIFTFLKILKPYEKGEHMEIPKVKKILTYKRVEELKVVSEKETELSLDGEMISGKEFTIKALHKALNFIIPAN